MIYIDGQRFGEHHILSAVGVDAEGKKHILGIESGATENAASVKRLLTHLRDQGLPTDRKYCSSSMGPKHCAPPSRRCSAAINQCSGAAITSYVMLSIELPKSSRVKR